MGAQRPVLLGVGVVFLCASLYHGIGAISYPAPPPDALLYNEACTGVAFFGVACEEIAYHALFAMLNLGFASALFTLPASSPVLTVAVFLLSAEQVLDHGARAYTIEARGDPPDWGSLAIVVLLPVLTCYMLAFPAALRRSLKVKGN